MYGIIEEIWEVDYTKFFVPVFKCKWVDGKSTVKINESGFTLVDFQKIGYRDEPLIMVQQASPIFHRTLVCRFTLGKNKGRLLMILKMGPSFIHTNDNCSVRLTHLAGRLQRCSGPSILA